MRGRDWEVPGGAAGLLTSRATLLHPEETVFAAMLSGWATQQASRGLATSTIKERGALTQRFATFTGAYPWQWAPADVEEWTAELRGKGLVHSTLRSYQLTIRRFCDFVTDPRYGWVEVCEQRFGSGVHPVQICHDWNTITHTSPYEAQPGSRPLTRQELQRLLDYADDQVGRVRRLGRKGWMAAYRDATLLKVLYAWGLRRREAAMLDVADVGANAAAPEFGEVGALSVRWGKAVRGSPPRRRTVLTVMPWAAEAVRDYLEEVLPLYGQGGRGPLWPTERGGRVSAAYVNTRFAAYRDAVGLPGELGPHCLRHSYITHLVEDGWDPRFVQEQAGHLWASTTALYTGVSNDFKNTMLRRALERVSHGALTSAASGKERA